MMKEKTIYYLIVLKILFRLKNNTTHKSYPPPPLIVPFAPQLVVVI